VFVTSAPLLSVRSLRHAYGKHVIFDSVSFKVTAGSALALVGKNGSGKSTLLRCITGAEELTAGGTVEYAGSAYDEASPRIRREVATVFDDIDFFPDLTVAEHLDLLARAHGVADVEDTVDAVLYELGIAGASDQFPGTLSSGQRHRLALATAFVRPRRLLLLDEPEQRLDDEGRAWLAEKLRADLADGVAVVFASHSADLVAAVGGKVLRVDEVSRADPASTAADEGAPSDGEDAGPGGGKRADGKSRSGANTGSGQSSGAGNSSSKSGAGSSRQSSGSGSKSGAGSSSGKAGGGGGRQRKRRRSAGGQGQRDA
jgi:ABC-2 type transport system ATP-binding protein